MTNGQLFTRRKLLQAAGASAVIGVSGCLASDDEGTPTDGDGYAPDSTANETNSTGNGTETADGSSPATTVDESSFEVKVTEGVPVPLAPIDVVYDWYRNQEARFVDARGEDQYERSHIKGAVLSPAGPAGHVNNDPVENWPKSDRIITYCGCPHHLSSLRAADLIDQGYERVFALDEGYREWTDRDYPIEGSDTDAQPKIQAIKGATDPKFAGETAWAFHSASDQQEATEIQQNGYYAMEIPFYDVSDDSLIQIKTPGYTIEQTLGSLTKGTVTPDGTLSMNEP